MTVMASDVQERPIRAEAEAPRSSAFAEAAGEARDHGRVQLDRPPARSSYFRRPSAPSHRCRNMDMQRSTFLKFIACWGAGLAFVLASALAIRFLG